MKKRYRVLASRELYGFELFKIRHYLGMMVSREAILAMIGNYLECRCSLSMIPNDGFDGTLRCDFGGDSMREYAIVV